MANDFDIDQLNEFTSRGHTIVRGALPCSAINEARAPFLDYINKMHSSLNRFERLLGASSTRATFKLNQAPESVRNFVCSHKLGQIAAKILDVPRVRILHFNGFFKPAGGIATPWHQDMTYIPLDCDNIITIWVPLVPITKNMGSLIFASESHRFGSSAMIDIESKFDLTPNEPMRPGDISIHHGWTVHCSNPNNSDETREAVAISYYPDGTKVRLKSDAPPMMASILGDCLPGLNTGDIAQSPATPIVFDENIYF